MIKRNKSLSLEDARTLLEYNPYTGELHWRCDIGDPYYNRFRGTLAGNPHSKGYREIKVRGVQYLAHCVAWLLMTGSFPPDHLDIDHKNRNKSDNRWDNLELKSRSDNKMNAGAYSTNKSGFRGVHFHKMSGKWAAALKGKHLGLFPTPEEAHEAYCLFAEFKGLSISVS